jgi:50S ribosomal subunit-associated GTPase HflX
MAKQATSTAQEYPITLLLGIYTPTNMMAEPTYYFDEFKSLVDTLGVPYDHEITIKLRSLDKGYFLTKGKLEEVQLLCEKKALNALSVQNSLPLCKKETSKLFLTAK